MCQSDVIEPHSITNNVLSRCTDCVACCDYLAGFRSGGWWASFLLGNFHAKIGNAQQAISAYSVAVAQKPLNPFTFVNAGNAYLMSAGSARLPANSLVNFAFPGAVSSY